MTQCALLLLDTRKAYGNLNIDCEESLDPAGTGSFYNYGEADIVAQHVLNLVQCGMFLLSLIMLLYMIIYAELVMHLFVFYVILVYLSEVVDPLRHNNIVLDEVTTTLPLALLKYD